MTTTRQGAAAVAALALAVLLTACTGGTESNAATEANEPEQSASQQQIDAQKEIATISPVIPIYQGAQYSSGLSKRDEVTIRGRYGANAKVYTLASDDSYPQVYHYYTTYLGQFRSYEPRDTYPPEKQEWRTFEVPLNQAMQDPFVPGAALDPNGKQVILQIAETEAEPKTVIRYIVTPSAPPAAPAAPAVASATAAASTAPIAR